MKETPPAEPLEIRRACLGDASAYARIMGDAEVIPGTNQMPYTSEELWRARLAEALAPGKTDLYLVAERGGRVVGSCGLHPQASVRRRHALTLGITVAPEAQRQGVGSAMMAALCDYADNWFAALRVELTVFTDNARAVALYRKYGFVIEGTLRGYALRNGRYTDVYSMARLHPQPPTLAPTQENRS